MVKTIVNLSETFVIRSSIADAIEDPAENGEFRLGNLTLTLKRSGDKKFTVKDMLDHPENQADLDQPRLWQRLRTFFSKCCACIANDNVEDKPSNSFLGDFRQHRDECTNYFVIEKVPF